MVSSENRWENARSAFTGRTPVIVADIDSGGTILHKHLEGYRTTSGEWDYVQNDSNASDESGHGTMVAGIIAGATGDGKSVAGICPTARILPIRGFDNAGFIADGPRSGEASSNRQTKICFYWYSDYLMSS